jgi:hypothetical protein
MKLLGFLVFQYSHREAILLILLLSSGRSLVEGRIYNLGRIDRMRKIQCSAEQTIITAHLSPEYLFCQESLTINSLEGSFFGICEKWLPKNIIGEREILCK